MIIKAKYIAPRGVLDGGSATFSCPVVRMSDGSWRLQTAHGLKAIDFYLSESAAISGVIEFADYVIRPAENLRPCDAINAVNAVRATLPWPIRPERPTVPAPDSRLHIEPRLPTQSSFAQLQQAASEKVAEQRRQREAERTEMRNAPANQQAIDRSRRLNNAFADRMRPPRTR